MVRAFICKVDNGNHTCDGHLLVNGDMVFRPKDIGGLRILDLVRFGRPPPSMVVASTDQTYMMLMGLALPCDDMNMDRFRAATKITTGNSMMAIFCFDRYLGGKVPKGIPPLAFARPYCHREHCRN